LEVHCQQPSISVAASERFLANRRCRVLVTALLIDLLRRRHTTAQPQASLDSGTGRTFVHGRGGLLVGAAHVVGLHVRQRERLVVHFAGDITHAVDVGQNLPQISSS